jgi:hypothetical protein
MARASVLWGRRFAEGIWGKLAAHLSRRVEWLAAGERGNASPKESLFGTSHAKMRPSAAACGFVNEAQSSANNGGQGSTLALGERQLPDNPSGEASIHLLQAEETRG